MPISTTTSMLFQSVRKSEIASVLALLRSGVVLIPLLYIFQGMNLGFTGIAISQPISYVLTALLSAPFLIGFIIKNHDKEYKNGH